MTNSHPITIAAESWSKLAMDREKITKYLIVPPYLSTKTDEGAFLLAICHVQLGNYMEAKRLFEKAITAMLEEPRPHWKAARPHWLVDVCILSGRDDLYADVRRELDLFRQGGKGNSLLFLYAYRVKVRNLGGMSAKQWTRYQMDRLGIGRELSEIPWGRKRVKLPPSGLKKKSVSGVPM